METDGLSELKQDDKVLNETKFSIQGLEARSYLSEWIFHELLNHEDLVHLQYEFFESEYKRH